MEVTHGINAVSLSKADQGIGFALQAAVRDYYPENLRKFQKDKGEHRVLMNLVSGKWPFPQHIFPELVNVQGVNCSFIVHSEWLKKAFVFSEEAIQVIDEIVEAVAKIVGQKLRIHAFISPTNKMRGHWNVKGDERYELPIMSIRKLISSELNRAIIFSMPPKMAALDLPDESFEMINFFLLGLSDQWLDLASDARDFYESVKTLDRLFAEISKLVK